MMMCVCVFVSVCVYVCIHNAISTSQRLRSDHHVTLTLLSPYFNPPPPLPYLSLPGGSTRRGGGGIASSDQEELLLNTVATATNVTYYSCHAGLNPPLPPSSSSSSSSSSASTLRNYTTGIGSSNTSNGGNSSVNSPTRSTAQRQVEKHSRQLVTLCRQLTRCLFHENEVCTSAIPPPHPNSSLLTQYTLSMHILTPTLT